MDSRQHSWIDRRELAELLQQLLPDSPAPAPGQPAPEVDDPISLLADNAPDWDEPSTAPLHRSEAELRREALHSLKSILPFTTGSFSPEDGVLHPQPPPAAQPKPLPPSPPSFPAPSGPEFHMPSGSLSVRLRAFTAWVGRVTGCTQIFITDSQGYSLLDSDDSGDATAVSSALQLLEALDKFRARTQLSNARSGVYLPLGPNEWFGVVECDSSLGTACLCLLIPAPLSAGAALELARVLRQTLEA